MVDFESKLEIVLKKLENYIESEDYHGYDPFDALKSPIFKFPILKSNKILRLVSQQVLKRTPINFRPLLGIKKGLNPVTLGLCIQAYTTLIKSGRIHNDYKENIYHCIDNLIKLKSNGFSGICWGYDFDWEARYARIPAFFPTVVATGIICNGLFEYYSFSRDTKIKELIIDASNFVINDLNRTESIDGICFSYSPGDNQKVYNASAKAARLLTQAYSLNNDEELLNIAKKAFNFIVKNQRKDGSWSYSLGDTRTWIDNFHTAYILDCLKDFQKITGSTDYDESIAKGFYYYLNNFFTEHKIPKYYNNCIYPIDSTAVSQSIITLCNFDQLDIAKEIIKWTLENLYHSSGYFYYQKRKYYTNKISYMRWSNSWMFLALTKFIFKRNEVQN